MLAKNRRKPKVRRIHSLGLVSSLAVLALAPTARAQAAPDLALSVRGRLQQVAGLATEHLAIVELEWTPPSNSSSPVGAAGVAFTEVDADLETAPGTELPLDPLERDEPGGSAVPNGSRRLRDGLTKQPIAPAEIPFVLSPSLVRATVDAALAAQGIIGALARLDSLASRARTSAMLPEMRLRAGRDRDQSLRMTPTVDDPYRYSQSGGVSLVVEAAVTWRLGRLLFAGEELSIERLRLAQARERQRLVAITLNELLIWQMARRRVLAAGDRVTNATEELFESSLRLDVLTNGWFSLHQSAGQPPERSKPTGSGPKPGASPAAAQDVFPAPAPMAPSFRPKPREARGAAHSDPQLFAVRQEQLEGTALSR